ncbi:uncharacterized protein LOC132707671 [Cylas formicarius]|uniref:uncharacterized protein LOC132707671 n=1 Tax=Cylas formicarius TaxID=197179 RepID=UPI00295832CC|nr:uncharacterized protein LOC132707671 [Cylas formicarius]
MVEIILGFLVFLLLGYAYVNRSYSYWKRKGVEQLEPAFPFGNYGNFFRQKQSFYLFFKEVYGKLKSRGVKFGGLYFVLRPVLVPLDLQVIKAITIKDFDHFGDRGFYANTEADPLSGHLVSLDGLKWKSLRIKLTPTFTSGKMKTMFGTILECASTLNEVLSKHAEDKNSVDIKNVLERFTMDVIGYCAFGIDCNSLKKETPEFVKYAKRAFNNSFWDNFKVMLSQVLPYKIARLIRLKITNDQVEKFFLNIVKDTVEYRERNKVARKDFLHMLLQLKNHGKVLDDEQVFEKTGTGMSLNEIAAQCFVFFLAGFDTSSTTIMFALYELSRNQELQDKAREEILSVLNRHNNEITYEAVLEMHYLEQVVQEALRMYPPAAHIQRICVKKYKVPGADLTIEKGTLLQIPVSGLHWDPEYYPEPEKFDPDRFSEARKTSIPSMAYMPFGEGPRQCIGMRFGLVESKVGLATILKDFRLTLNKKTPDPLEFGTVSIITSLNHPLWLDMVRLSDNCLQAQPAMFIFVVLSLLVIFIACHVRRSHSYWRRHGVEEIYPIHPIFGNAREVFLCNESVYEFFLRVYPVFKKKGVKYGGIYTFAAHNLVIMDPELINDIMVKSFDHFGDRAGYLDEKREPLTAHLVNLKGAKWKSMRNRVTPTFTSGKMRMMYHIFVFCSLGLRDMIGKHVRKKESVDIKRVLARFTTDIVGNCAFGYECNAMNDPNSEFNAYGRKAFERTLWENAKLVIASIIPKSVVNALGIHVTNEEVAKFFINAIVPVIKYRETHKISRRDFLGMLLRIRKRDDEAFEKTGDECSLTLTQIAALCFVFFLAGFETSSTAMTFALYELACNQDVQDKLRREINRVLRTYNGEMTYEAIQEMTYLENVIYEALRKYPPIAVIPRTCTQTYKIPNSDIVIEKDDVVYIPTSGLHWDPEYFPEPEKFDPDRFTDENKATRPRFAYLAFGGGPRNCIGLRFGLLQSKVGVATIVRNFRLTLNPRTAQPLKFDGGVFTTTAEGGIWLDVQHV